MLKLSSKSFVGKVRPPWFRKKVFENGAVVQLVRISACHAGGRGFEPHLHRILESWQSGLLCRS